ncbi:MAG TPA: hypothetical protein VGR91_04195 [Stellaceae bacterium]|nr:hypothetical protein [Stellaceae bacterium]
MIRFLLASLFFGVLAAGGARAQQLAPPGPPPAPPAAAAQERTFCEQDVSFTLAPKASVPRPYRRFFGMWSDAAWDVRSCAALIVENIAPNGTASILYIYGPMGSDEPGPGGVLRGTGVIRGGELRFQNADGSQFTFRPGIVDLDGSMTTPKGQTYQSVFKQTF